MSSPFPPGSQGRKKVFTLNIIAPTTAEGRDAPVRGDDALGRPLGGPRYRRREDDHVLTGFPGPSRCSAARPKVTRHVSVWFGVGLPQSGLPVEPERTGMRRLLISALTIAALATIATPAASGAHGGRGHLASELRAVPGDRGRVWCQLPVLQEQAASRPVRREPDRVRRRCRGCGRVLPRSEHPAEDGLGPRSYRHPVHGHHRAACAPALGPLYDKLVAFANEVLALPTYGEVTHYLQFHSEANIQALPGELDAQPYSGTGPEYQECYELVRALFDSMGVTDQIEWQVVLVAIGLRGQPRGPTAWFPVRHEPVRPGRCRQLPSQRRTGSPLRSRSTAPIAFARSVGKGIWIDETGSDEGSPENSATAKAEWFAEMGSYIDSESRRHRGSRLLERRRRRELVPGLRALRRTG